MCGICGVIGANGVLAEKRVRAMTDALVHRGPDDHGALVRPGTIFGVRRLSIIDLPGGHQPIFNEAGNIGVVLNGEIYNFLQLRAELERCGHHFQTRSDTEVIVHAYEEWGERCVERLEGMFAFALWHGADIHGADIADTRPRRGRVFLARDRFGIKPLYYTCSAGSLWFASELRALLASEACERRLSIDAVESFLLFGSVVEPATILRGVYCLPAGHTLTLELDSPICPQPRPYWALSPDVLQPESPQTLPTAARRVRVLLEKAVREQLLADVPLGVFLSGGLDSSSLAALAARERKGVQTFTLSFPEREFDEAAAARATARRLGTDHRELLLTSEEMQSRLLEALSALDQPSMDGVNTFFVSWGARQAGLKVALSGLGGDEIFCGYPSFRATHLLAKLRAIALCLPEQVRKPISRVLAESGPAWQSLPDQLRKLASVLRDPHSFPHAYFFARLLFTPAQTEELLCALTSGGSAPNGNSGKSCWRNSLEECARRAEEFHGHSRISYLESRTYMLNTLLRDTDSMSMHHSLEVRVPFLDRELVEFVLALPDRAKAEAHAYKVLLAEAVKDLLPPELLRRPKRTFTLPWEQWLRGSLAARVTYGLETLTPSLASILDAQATKSIVHEFLIKRIGWARPWSLFVLNEWVRMHIDEPVARDNFSPDGATDVPSLDSKAAGSSSR